MKKIVLFAMFVVSTGYSQISAENFNDNFYKLLEKLDAEDWKYSEKICSELLMYSEANYFLNTEQKVLRYIKIYSIAGLLNDGIISKEDALEKVKYLKGAEMIMPAHPFNNNCYINCTKISDKDKNTFFTGVNNKKGTQIFAFEYVKIKKRIIESDEELKGKFIILSGKLTEISVEGNMLPRFKLIFTDGDYEIKLN